MTNKPAEDAYRTASQLAKLYSKLDVARNIINDALDESPANFDQCQFDRIMDIRDKLNREIGLIFDLSKREAHRICSQLPEQPPAPPVDPENDWVTQDLVPDRPYFDQWRWVGKGGPNSTWHHTTNSPFYMHGYIHPDDGTTFEVRCRRKDLPSPTPPVTSPDEDQKRTLSGPELPELDSPIFPPDPTFMQVHSLF